MTIQGIDYAFAPHPAATVISGHGYKFAGRYVSPISANDGNGKNLQAPELAALRAAGLGIVIAAESAANRMLDGHAAGVADATHAQAVTAALGIATIPVYFACDFDGTALEQPAIDEYLRGAASVIGIKRTGLYSGFWPMTRAFAAGLITYGWQAYAWSAVTAGVAQPPHSTRVAVGGREFWFDVRAQIRQLGTVTIGGAACDVDEAAAPDFGQWPRPAAATSPQPAPAPSTGSWPAGLTLRQGDTGPAVKVLQQALHDSGAYGARGLEPIDGVFGSSTLLAVRNFQADKHLTVDGIAGPQSRAALGV